MFSQQLLSEYKKKYAELEQLIQKRIEFEKNHQHETSSPYVLHKTDINFCDVDSRSLLWYAAAMGDLQKVTELVEKEGANVDLFQKDAFDISEPAIVAALFNGHLDVAKYLFEKGAKCHHVNLNLCKGEAAKKWYAEKLQQAANVFHKRPDMLNEAKDLSFPQDPDEKIVAQFFKKKKSKRPPLLLGLAAAEIGDIGLLENVLSLYEISQSEKRLFLVNAARYGQLEVIKLLMKYDNSLIEAKIPYQPLPLNVAILNKHDHVVQYLLSQNVNVNDQDAHKVSALMIALSENDEALAKQLLEKNADPLQVDFRGKTALHFAALASGSVVKLILDVASGKAMLDQKDIYGRKPIDIAIEYHKSEVIALLDPHYHDKNTGTTKKSIVNISQRNILVKMFYYLKLKYRDVEPFSVKGYCKGISLIAHLRNMDQYYFDTLQFMASWDGRYESLDESFSGISQGQYYLNLGELFEQWINDITWGQYGFDELKIPKRYSTPELVEVISDNQFHSIHHFESHDLNKEQIKEILFYFCRMPPLTHLEIFSVNHATSVYNKNEKMMIFYDPNFPRETTPVLDADELFKRVIDWQYILTTLYREKMEFAAQFFCFQHDLNAIKLDDFSIFRSEEFPVSRKQANEFQSKSPHHFTHLHVAVMTKSIMSLKRLIKDNHCNINAKDCFGKTALDMALDARDVQAVEVLLALPDMEMRHQFSPLLLRAYQQGVFQSSDEINISILFRVAITQLDFNLAKKLFLQYQEEMEKKALPSQELIKAMKAGADETVDFLLNLGASVTRVGSYDNTPLKTAFSQNQYYSKIISKLKDINESDELGFSAIHYAAKEHDVALLVDLLGRGADVMKKSRDGGLAYKMSGAQYISIYSSQSSNLFSEHTAKNKRLETRQLIINALDLARDGDRLQLIDILRDPYEDNKVYEMAAARSDFSIDHKELLGPLILMVSHSEFVKAELLLKHGANINALTEDNQTLLMLFVNAGQDQDVITHLEFILRHNPDLNIADETGKTVLDMVEHSNNEEIKQVFKPHMPTNTPKK